MQHPIDRERLLDRFLRYVRIDTTAQPESTKYPSSPGQLELGRLLVQELQRMGLLEAYQDEHGIVTAMIPATVPGPWVPIALIAHLDTSPEAPGANVDPQVIREYSGGDIPLRSGGKVIRESETPGLASLVGKTLITTDGSTLLGGDDKAGVAVIMELAQHLIERPFLPHGPIRVLFTCDEEIGRGVEKYNATRHGAYVGYTLDGGGSGSIDVETFSADAAQVVLKGHNIHPSIAKGRMINALRAAADFVQRLPRQHDAPEATEGREGFMHPYQIAGGVGEARVDLLLRSFETAALRTYAQQLQDLAQNVMQAWPGLSIEVSTRPQYRNLGDGLKKIPAAVSLAEAAFACLDRPCRRSIVRGGTDGSQLTALGMPTPNLSCGQHNIHAVTEFACLDEMVEAVEHLVVLLRLWQESTAS